MKKTEIKDIPTDVLKKKEKLLRLATGILIGMLIVLVAAAIFISVNNQSFSPMLVVALALFPISLMNIQRIKKIKEEIRRR
ncbi:MAG: redox-active disulfide protein 2 [Bacteroidia bacterium]|nr:redox-active disulfide protein 2 [Bacteroidia bacterium]